MIQALTAVAILAAAAAPAPAPSVGPDGVFSMTAAEHDVAFPGCAERAIAQGSALTLRDQPGGEVVHQITGFVPGIFLSVGEVRGSSTFISLGEASWQGQAPATYPAAQIEFVGGWVDGFQPLPEDQHATEAGACSVVAAQAMYAEMEAAKEPATEASTEPVSAQEPTQIAQPVLAQPAQPAEETGGSMMLIAGGLLAGLIGALALVHRARQKGQPNG